MTNNEYTQVKNQIIKEHQQRLKAFQLELNKEFSQKIKAYSQERIKVLNTNNIEIGDIITDNETIILVKSIDYCHCEFDSDKSYLEFRGIAYTKKLTPKKNDNGTSFIQQRYGLLPTILKRNNDGKNNK